ncbi:hypothetical protein CYMTET_46674 [Cymbomonas tetramitiformis]|uniref:DEP domain-containing protein n=1 Tax=Cymbomonas tetramitiformis TaxID=36881 RepID=A0AAE0BVR8_9CHLO|nr:hypothetical protein CYMTET_46674 [Cymbomonas tetramitiformis]
MRMRNEISVKNRRYHFSVYEKCFVGERAVKWLSQSCALDGPEAVKLGNRMLFLGLLHHVTHEHVFRDAYFFYRFSLDDSKDSSDDSSEQQGHKQDCQSDWSISREVVNLKQQIYELTHQLKDRSTQVEELTEQLENREQQGQLNIEFLNNEIQNAQHTFSAEIRRLDTVTKELSLSLQLSRFGLLMCAVLDAGFGIQLWKGLAALMFCVIPLLPPQLQRGSLPTTSSTQETSNQFPPDERRSFKEKGIALLDRCRQIQRKRSSAAERLITTPVQPPVRLRVCRFASAMRLEGDREALQLNDGIPIPFETDVFKGKFVAYVAGLENSPAHIFEGKKRKTHLIFQGQFKRELAYSEVFTGHEFHRPLKHLPPNFLIEAVLKIFRKISPSVQISGLHSENPRALFQMAASSQAMCISENFDSAPDCTRHFEEDVRLAGPLFRDSAGLALPAWKRRRLLTSQSTSAKFKFDPDLVYTFAQWQDALDVTTFKLNAGIKSFDIHRILDGQPVPVMARAADGSYLWYFELWHAKCSETPN